MKFNTDLLAATETIECVPGFVYVVGKSPQQAVQRFNNNISNEQAIRIARQNGAVDLDISFPDEKEKGQETETAGPDLEELN